MCHNYYAIELHANVAKHTILRSIHSHSLCADQHITWMHTQIDTRLTTQFLQTKKFCLWSQKYLSEMTIAWQFPLASFFIIAIALFYFLSLQNLDKRRDFILQIYHCLCMLFYDRANWQPWSSLVKSEMKIIYLWIKKWCQPLVSIRREYCMKRENEMRCYISLLVQHMTQLQHHFKYLCSTVE